MEKNDHSKNRKIDIDSFLINENILYLLNKARTSPKSFSKYLNVNNKSDIEIINLYNFFNNYSLKVAPLISNINLSICSKDLLEHILSEEVDIEVEKKKYNLKKRLKRLNLNPVNDNNFIILDAYNPLDAVINLFLNDDYRNIILDPDVKYIGIASELLLSGNLCIIIDTVESLENIKSFTKKRNKYLYEVNKSNENIKRTINLSTNYTDKKPNNYRKKFIKKFVIIPDYIEYKYKYPISVYIRKQYIKDKYGNLKCIYNRESNYDDGSVLIQPNIEKDYNL
jgi:hypothetical protein